MLGRGLAWTISSRRIGCLSQRVFNTDVRESLSSVSSNLSTVNGLPTTRLGRTLFLELGVREAGSRAVEIEGDVDISSSRSGEGDAFRFLEGPEEDTDAAVSTL